MTTAKTSPDAWVYIAECADGSLYTGATTDPDRRETEHNSGTGARYTRSRRPVKIVFKYQFESLARAVSAESRIKRWARSKKEALVENRFELEAELTACREPGQPSSRTRILSPTK